jgi:hypothetical protein
VYHDDSFVCVIILVARANVRLLLVVAYASASINFVKLRFDTVELKLF